MIRQIFNARRRQILIDVNTQRDFFLADGKACIRNHKKVLSHVRRIMAWARRNEIPIISACEIYPNAGGSDEMRYCLDGTDGQKKISYTKLSSRISFPADGSSDLPGDLLRKYRQVVLNKRTIDPFEEPRLERLLSEINAADFIVMGATAEGAVKSTVLGLLQRGKNVSVVVDAVGYIERYEAEMAFRKMRAKGAKMVDVKRLAGDTHLNNARICKCKLCTESKGAEAMVRVTA